MGNAHASCCAKLDQEFRVIRGGMDSGRMGTKFFLFLPSGLIEEFIHRDCHFIDPMLNYLNESIPTLLLAFKSKNAIKTYTRGIKKWVMWSAPFPALHSSPLKAFSLTLSITSMLQSAERLSGII